MSTPVFHRRRVEHFAQLLDEAAGDRQNASAVKNRELADLAALGQRLFAVPPVGEVDPRFRAELRAQLMAVAAAEGIGATARTGARTLKQKATREPASRRARTRSLVVIGVAVGAITVSGISAASENSLPGDALYGMKRSTERAQLVLASDANRGKLLIDFAQTRLSEAQALRDDGAMVASLLDQMDAHTRDAVRELSTSAVRHRDAALLDDLASFAAEQRRQLATMRESVSGVQRERVSASLALLDAVDERIGALRAALACGVATADEIDSLGPVPASCEAGG